MSETNRQLVLRDRPTGEVGDEHFELSTSPVPEPGDGEVLLRTLWLSFDPAQRGWLNDVRSYVPPVAIGEPMRAYGIGEVVTSNADGVEAGRPRPHLARLAGLRRREPRRRRCSSPSLPTVTQPEMMLGLLGMTGLTAYFGMTDVGRPVEGDAVLVTAAAGATGSIAGQIARIKGATQVIGTAGAEEKRDWVRDVAGFDDCLDHYDENILRLIRAANRDGYQVVFDNVGGTLLDACLFNIAVHARVVLCGSISTGYKPQRPDVGIYYYQLLTMRRSLMQGFLVSDYQDRFDEARADLLRWSEEGRLVPAVRHRRGPGEGAGDAQPALQGRQPRQAAPQALTAGSGRAEAVEEAGGAVGEGRHRRAPLAHPRVGALAAHEALVELLEHDARLPRRERLVPGHVGGVEAGPRPRSARRPRPATAGRGARARGRASGRSPSESDGSGQ